MCNCMTIILVQSRLRDPLAWSDDDEDTSLRGCSSSLPYNLETFRLQSLLCQSTRFARTDQSKSLPCLQSLPNPSFSTRRNLSRKTPRVLFPTGRPLHPVNLQHHANNPHHRTRTTPRTVPSSPTASSPSTSSCRLRSTDGNMT